MEEGQVRIRNHFFMISMIVALLILNVISSAVYAAPSKDASTTAETNTEITDLRVEYRTNPIGVDSEKPRFSWEMASNMRGQKQTAYQLLVASSPEKLTPNEADVWNSGKVDSDESLAVEYGGDSFNPTTRYYWTVMVWDKNENLIETPEANYFETGILSTDGVTGWDGAKWISIDSSEEMGAPMLRKETSLNGDVESARLYISSLGVFDAYINGERVGIVNEDGSTSYELLAPGWTAYHKNINYMSYDVTSYVQGDENVTLAAVLGNGWYNGDISSGAEYYSRSGNDLGLLAKMLITYEDGSSETVVTDTTSGWKATNNSPYTENDIYDGETYDATKEIPDWNKNGFDDSNWNDVKEHDYTQTYPDATVTSYNGKTAQIVDELDQTPISVTTYDSITNEESSSNGEGEIEVDPSRTVTDPSVANEYEAIISQGDTVIYDLGQNMVGVPRINVKGEEGTQIRIRFSEMLNDDSQGADGPEGSVYLENLRGADATAYYTLKGTEEGETYQTSLSFFGFRYVEVSVVTPDDSVEIQNLTGKVATSAVDVTGTIETSDEDVNQLISNIQWGQRGNYLWIPTDCPQRNERAGWLGDVQLFAKTGFYNMDSYNFIENFADNIVENQYDNGSIPVTVPRTRYSRNTSPDSGWSDAGVIVPWTHWQMSGDTRVIEKSYPSMEKYMDLIFEMTGDTYRGPGSFYGDWLSFQREDVNQMGGANHNLISDAFYAYDAKLMAQMAEALGYSDDAEKYQNLFDNIKSAFIENYIKIDGDSGSLTLLSGSREGTGGEDNAQTSLLWALKLEMYESEDQKQQMIDLLTANIRNSDEYKEANPTSSRVDYAENTLAVGFLGVNVLAPVLSDHGNSDLAYTLLLQDEMPSWLYSVKNGATTIWERWNSYSKEDGFGPASMNSFNHFSYGAIGEWMYSNMLGIANDPANPGFKHIILQPSIDGNNQITHADGSFDSLYGMIESGWEVEGETLMYNTAVPANTTATLHLPVGDITSVKESGQPVSEVEGVKFVEYKNGKAIYELSSGSYNFTTNLSNEPGTVENIDELHALVSQYTQSGYISDEQFARTMDTQLTSVKLYEESGETEKLIKHLNNFLALLDYVKQQGSISDVPYNDLKTGAEYLVNNQQ
ncbi:family 78 glycoside hydrolase catalytic domain [Gracilibacillus massiliensis]|uniref:family 78 glycoside hydrolase catalytic domain n=1 Tax=Gracilibacillus massiliensis TaxID=1564956 RepID=UPI00097BC82E|nr:family 78 glycoside hydrolase catalytic domain [Gracilibacillus massiliensis]